MLLGLLAPGCELGSAGGASVQGAAGASMASPQPAFQLEALVALLAASSNVILLPGHTAYLRLAEQAADVELRGLLRHAAPAVRVYAFHALTERHGERSFAEELSLLISDLAAVQIYSDSQKPIQSSVADYALERVADRLSEAERNSVAARVLGGGIPVEFASRIKRKWTLGPELHEPLQELARAGDGEALLALARYRDPADIPLIVAALQTPAAAEALQAIAHFPDGRFVAPLRSFQKGLLGHRAAHWQAFRMSKLPPAEWDRPLTDPSPYILCHFYAAVLHFEPAVAEEFLAAPFAANARTANVAAHAACQRWVLPPELLQRHVAAGFRLWDHNSGLLTEQLQVLWAADAARARRLTLASAPELGRFSPDTAIWLLQQVEGSERAAALRGLRAGLRRASKAEIDNLGVVMRALQLRELLPELFARLERSRPLTDANMSTFREELTRPLVREISLWPLSEAERLRLVSWVMGGRAARERDTKDPIGQRIVEDYLVSVLGAAGLLQPG